MCFQRLESVLLLPKYVGGYLHIVRPAILVRTKSFKSNFSTSLFKFGVIRDIFELKFKLLPPFSFSRFLNQLSANSRKLHCKNCNLRRRSHFRKDETFQGKIGEERREVAHGS